MNALANQCASVLTSLGVGKGDRVALLMPNSVEFCCLFYGAAKIGAVAVPLNTRLTAPNWNSFCPTVAARYWSTVKRLRR